MSGVNVLDSSNLIDASTIVVILFFDGKVSYDIVLCITGLLYHGFPVDAHDPLTDNLQDYFTDNGTMAILVPVK